MEAFHVSNPAASTFHTLRPWNSDIRDSVGAAALQFWESELKDPARIAMIEGNGRVPRAPPGNFAPQNFAPLPPLAEVLRQDALDRASKGNGKGAQAAQAAAQAKKVKKAALKKKRRDEGRSSVAADGVQICFSWNRAAKGCVDGKCPNNRAHVCERCGAQHRSIHCKAPNTDGKPT